MDLPALVERVIDDEPPETVLALGEDDLAVFTSDELLFYRGESLLRDAELSRYPTNAVGLRVQPGRRKSTIVIDYQTEQRQFTVQNSHADRVVERLLAGILTTTGVIDGDESLGGVYRFSDLTVVVTETKLLKQIGTDIWGGEYDAFPFEQVDALSFERGRIATQVVLSVDGRSERIKAPHEEAPHLRQTLTDALLSFHGDESLEAFNAQSESQQSTRSAVSAVALDESIPPLIESETTRQTSQPKALQSVGGRDTAITDEPDSTPQLTALARTVERQQELLEQQAARIDALERKLNRLLQD